MSKRISIASKFRKRALNITEESDRLNFHKKYIPTRQSEIFVGDVASAILRGGGAHSLSGAYGAGKSSLSIFLMHQLCCKTKKFTPVPSRLRDKSCASVRESGGMVCISAVGASASLASRISEGAMRALSDYIGSPPKSLKKIANMRHDGGESEKILLLLGQLTDDLKNRKKAGVLLIIDEFGRHLERMVSRLDASDMYLLQGLAEMTGTRKPAMSLVVVQHYGMEHYSRHITVAQRQDWEKTRGRFNEFWLKNSDRDAAQITASLFSCSDKISTKAAAHARRCIKSEKMFRDSGTDFSDVAIRCWPIHPATIVALARLSTYIGQNERTLVGWVSSDFNTGFKSAANESHDWVYPSSLYRHFFENPSSLPVNPVWAKRISEICAADDRFDGDSDALTLFRTVAVLNCIGSGNANRDTLQMCLPEKFPLDKTISHLVERSLVIYRKHRGEYCVWQGSDYDFADAISCAIEKIGKFSLAAELNRSNIFPRIIAHRHLIETGNHRALSVEFVDEGEQSLNVEQDSPPSAFVFLMPGNKKGNIKMPTKSLGNNIYGFLPASKLSSLGREAAALRMMLTGDEKLQNDHVARGEVSRQLLFVEQQISDLVAAAFFSDIKWTYKGKPFDNIQSATSLAMKETYNKGFCLHSELINREGGGGQMTAALRALCYALIDSSDKEDLGISKYPSHLIIYKNFIKAMNMHVCNSGKYSIEFDSQKISLGLRPVVQKMESLLFDKDCVPHNLQDILDCLSAPPYGVKRGPAILLCILCLLHHKDRVALYENNKYLYKWNHTAIDRLIKAPDRFALASVAPRKATKVLLREYSVAVGGNNDVDTVLGVASALLIRCSKFSAYSINSENVSQSAQKFRNAVSNAKSPSDLLFDSVPAAFDCGTFLSDQAIRRKFFKGLQSTITELSMAPSDMISRFGDIICEHYGGRELTKSRLMVTRNAKAVLSCGRMYPVHKHFLLAVSNTGGDAVSWVRNIATAGLDVKKSPEHWTDQDEATAEYALRHNLIWLSSAWRALSKHQDADFFVAMDIGVNGASVPDAEVDGAVRDLKKRFGSDAVLRQAICKINRHLQQGDNE